MLAILDSFVIEAGTNDCPTCDIADESDIKTAGALLAITTALLSAVEGMDNIPFTVCCPATLEAEC
jgi:hypothetical protein